jgi:hypothetical protein
VSTKKPCFTECLYNPVCTLVTKVHIIDWGIVT